MDTGYINRCLRWLTNELSPFYVSGTVPTHVKSKMDVFYKCVENTIDWYNLTRRDMLALGFLNWEVDEESSKGIWFIPVWLFPIIPEGLLLVDKNRNMFNFNHETAPKEVMYGCLTFGILLEE